MAEEKPVIVCAACGFEAEPDEEVLCNICWRGEWAVEEREEEESPGQGRVYA